MSHKYKKYELIELEKFARNMRADPKAASTLVPVCLWMDEALTLAIFRDRKTSRKTRAEIAHKMGISQHTLINVTREHRRASVPHAKKIVEYCIKWNVMISFIETDRDFNIIKKENENHEAN